MAASYKQRGVEFRVEATILRRVVWGINRKGKVTEYDHFCDLDVLKEVAWYIEEAKFGTTTGEMWEAFPDLPKTQISVALDFLKDRGCVFTRQRRVHAGSPCLFEDAMVEFYWLQHEGLELCGT